MNILKKKQKGTLLVAGLIFLSTLAIIGISAVTYTLLSEKMMYNQRDKERALQASEAALAAAETWLLSQNIKPSAVESCNNTPCAVWEKDSFSDWLSKDLTWWQAQGHAFENLLEGISTPPHYVIEEQYFKPYELDPDARSKGEGYYYYRVTSHGTGSQDETPVTLQSIYTIQYR